MPSEILTYKAEYCHTTEILFRFKFDINSDIEFKLGIFTPEICVSKPFFRCIIYYLTLHFLNVYKQFCKIFHYHVVVGNYKKSVLQYISMIRIKGCGVAHC